LGWEKAYTPEEELSLAFDCALLSSFESFEIGFPSTFAAASFDGIDILSCGISEIGYLAGVLSSYQALQEGELFL